MWSKLFAICVVLTFRFVVAADGKKVVCYFGSWSVYRPGVGKFSIEDIDTQLCTHLIYAFVGIGIDGSIRILDEWNDITNGGFRKFNELKLRNPDLKTLVAVGGWNEGSITFSQIAASAYHRSLFISNAIKFIQTFGFDGFDLDWEYPGQRGGSPQDKVNFAQLVREFRTAFNQEGYLLTAAVGATATAIALSYDVPALSENLDFIHVMAYDMHGAFDGNTGQNAPLYASSHDVTASDQEKNVAASMQAWIDNGAAPQKLILGIGVYGRSFTLHNTWTNGLNSPAGPGEKGPYTDEPGMLGYIEICEKQLSGQWTVVWDDEQKVPYSHLGNQWIGYDDVKSVNIKVEFAKQMNLGGLMIWSIETDDFRGTCGPKYPILSAINAGIR